MALTIFDDRSLTVSVRHVEAKPNGSFQYRRRIPVCLRSHYPGKLFFVRSLGRDPHALAHKAADLTAELDRIWGELTAAEKPVEAEFDAGSKGAGVAQTALQVLVYYLGRVRAPGSLKAPESATEIHFPAVARRDTINLQSALELYLSYHAKGGFPKFKADAERVVKGVMTTVGNLPLSLYTRQQAQEYRDNLLTRNSTGTVRRRLDTLVAIFNKAVAEEGLTLGNPFENLSIPQEGRDAKKRDACTNAELSIIATTFYGMITICLIRIYFKLSLL